MLSDEHLFFLIGWTDIGATYEGSSLTGGLSSSYRYKTRSSKFLNMVPKQTLKPVNQLIVTIFNNTVTTVEVMQEIRCLQDMVN
jgi:hypothetical protein